MKKPEQQVGLKQLPRAPKASWSFWNIKDTNNETNMEIRVLPGAWLPSDGQKQESPTGYVSFLHLKVDLA